MKIADHNGVIAATVTETSELSVVRCGECSGVYALSKRYVNYRQERGGFWICPYCKCSWGYPEGGTENERLRRELTAATATKERYRLEAEQNEARRRAEKAAKTKIKNRIAKGVCPCCNRHFKNLAGHMQTKHPDYAEARK